MVIRAARFNTYLLLVAASALAVGCRTAEGNRQKQTAALRLHLEVSANGPESSQSVFIHGFPVNVEKSPFLTEANVAEAKVVQSHGSFELQIRFDQQGAWLLEQYSGSNPGRRFAIVSMFGEKPIQTRWLAAPLITRRIGDGTLIFTPDATREEAEQIVIGLNNNARKTQFDAQ